MTTTPITATAVPRRRWATLSLLGIILALFVIPASPAFAAGCSNWSQFDPSNTVQACAAYDGNVSSITWDADNALLMIVADFSDQPAGTWVVFRAFCDNGSGSYYGQDSKQLGANGDTDYTLTRAVGESDCPSNYQIISGISPTEPDYLDPITRTGWAMTRFGADPDYTTVDLATSDGLPIAGQSNGGGGGGGGGTSPNLGTFVNYALTSWGGTFLNVYSIAALLLAVFVGVNVAWRWMRRAAKSG